ncbi:carbohydrate ABC transporter substrate-binding protein (CUT1 family) [Micromonospora pisi]|uniref:Carbohydrate ABC transporter substrate-binding protein (CUT1 family) n=1 Tax=Micromonospora pisi TaxID=589240 RepID=A0A495JAS4_9ACTN|nr:extracellular solute-binding protein [Micromonospora pisi]RKR85933.1 carbohydrate ABC transporter substrate-binding protein (CUT1 family) [Micromonospora pisi]
MRKPLALAALIALALVAGACAPSTGTPTESTDEKTGTLRVWLFDEANRAAKEAVVSEAVAEFTAAHPGVSVDVSYLATDTRAEKYKGALNDPASAPDVTEVGNTDLAGFVASNGMADVSSDLKSWSEAADLPADLVNTVTVDDKAYGVPWWIGVRALYYRTDVFTDLGLRPPTSYAELVSAAKRIRAEREEMLGIAVGGLYVFGALPFVWDAGGDIATSGGSGYTASIDSAASKAGITAYTDLFGDDICPAQQCVDLTGGGTVEAFAAGRAGMGILGNFNRSAVEAGAVKGRYAVVPLPGAKPGSIAPAFAGGSSLGVFRSTSHRTLAVEFMQLLAGRKYTLKLYDAMGFVPAMKSARTEVIAKDPQLKPFIDTMEAGTRFVPVDKAWTTIDAEKILPTLLQKVITKQATVDAATAEANTRINAAFGK